MCRCIIALWETRYTFYPCDCYLLLQLLKMYKFRNLCKIAHSYFVNFLLLSTFKSHTFPTAVDALQDCKLDHNRGHDQFNIMQSYLHLLLSHITIIPVFDVYLWPRIRRFIPSLVLDHTQEDPS